jgi:hypothetical protein
VALLALLRPATFDDIKLANLLIILSAAVKKGSKF